MRTQPYSIHLTTRPARIVYLMSLNEPDPLAFTCRLLEGNRRLWGGRWNPIIVTDGSSIPDSTFTFLEQYDADYLVSFVELSDKLKKRLFKLCPIEIKTDSQGRTTTPFNVVSIDPMLWFDAQNALPLYRHQQFVLFSLKKSTPEDVKLFLQMNFGAVDFFNITFNTIKDRMPNKSFREYAIGSHKELEDVLFELSESGTDFMFPSLLCYWPINIPELQRDSNAEQFKIVTGETLSDIAYYWNCGFRSRNHNTLSALWVPNEWLKKIDLTPSLLAYMNKMSRLTPNPSGFQIVSFSIQSEELNSYARSINSSSRIKASTLNVSNSDLPIFREQPIFRPADKQSILVRGNSSCETISIEEPRFELIKYIGQKFFIDVDIEYHPERFQSVQGRSFWWQLPRRSDLPSKLCLFDRPWRVNKAHSFSVMVERTSFFQRGNDLRFTLKIPEDIDVFHALFKNSYYTSSGEESCVLLDEISNVGKSLSGILRLFPDLFNAAALLEKRFWRTMFRRLAAREKDENIRNTVRNKIAKLQNNGEDSSVLADYVVNKLAEHSKTSKELFFNDFVRESENEVNLFNKDNSDNTFVFSPERLKDDVDDLLAQEILLIGLVPVCWRCGYRMWLPLSEVAQSMTCKGCGERMPIRSEEKWLYRLNYLAQAAFTQHGIVPTLLVLSRLMTESRSSFIFFPSACLKNNKQKQWHEIDLCCIQDGKFVIGEMKESCDGFKRSDFADMQEIAETVRANKILFSSLDPKPNSFVVKEIENLSAVLAPKGISVEWFQIEGFVFGPQPNHVFSR